MVAAGIDQVVKPDDVLAIGGNHECNRGVNAKVTATNREPPASPIQQLKHRSQRRIDAVGPTLDDELVALGSLKAISVGIAFGDPAADDAVQRDDLIRLSFLRLGFDYVTPCGDEEGSRRSDAVAADGLHIVEAGGHVVVDPNDKRVPVALGERNTRMAATSRRQALQSTGREPHRPGRASLSARWKDAV